MQYNLDEMLNQMFIPKGMASYNLSEEGDFSLIKECMTTINIWEEQSKKTGKYRLAFHVYPNRYLMEILTPILRKPIHNDMTLHRHMKSGDEDSFVIFEDGKIPWRDTRWELVDEGRSDDGVLYLIFHIFIRGNSDYFDGEVEYMYRYNIHPIGIKKHEFGLFLANLMKKSPSFFTSEKLNNTIGLEGFDLIQGEMYENVEPKKKSLEHLKKLYGEDIKNSFPAHKVY